MSAELEPCHICETKHPYRFLGRDTTTRHYIFHCGLYISSCDEALLRKTWDNLYKTSKLKQRIIETLEWMTTDAKWRADDTKMNIEVGSQGGYSPLLTEAIDLLEELKK